MNTIPHVGKIAVDLDLQLAQTETQWVPSLENFETWVSAALGKAASAGREFQLTIRVVDRAEITELNHTYRNKVAPTNVLSFPALLPEELQLPLLGDVIICALVVQQEAQEQNKAIDDHWAHLVIHGVLHLVGYDHTDEEEAVKMESLEVDILAGLGIHNPYVVENGKECHERH